MHSSSQQCPSPANGTLESVGTSSTPLELLGAETPLTKPSNHHGQGSCIFHQIHHIHNLVRLGIVSRLWRLQAYCIQSMILGLSILPQCFESKATKAAVFLNLLQRSARPDLAAAGAPIRRHHLPHLRMLKSSFFCDV